MERQFAVNTYGPTLFTQALIPNVLKAPAPRRNRRYILSRRLDLGQHFRRLLRLSRFQDRGELLLQVVCGRVEGA